MIEPTPEDVKNKIIGDIENHLNRVKGASIEPIVKAFYRLWLISLKENV